jgi:hypothetical protein
MPEDDDLEQLFGPVIFSYTDEQAVEDGVLIPLRTPAGRDTGHRITASAFDEMKDYLKGSEDDDTVATYVLRELLPLVPMAYRRDREQNEFLAIGYDFRVRSDGPLWLVPNERGGATLMKREDY